MILDENEQKLAATWFFIVGPIAFLFILFLAKVDLGLTYTDREVKRNDTMHELRLAQTSLKAVTLDDRNSGDRAYRGRQVTAEKKSHTSHD